MAKTKRVTSGITVSDVEVVPIDSITPNDRNPRYIEDQDFLDLVESIKSFPEMLFARPVVCDEKEIAIGGNMRWRAAKHAGHHNIPRIKMFGLTEKKRREFIIRDNINKGNWDYDILANEFDVKDLNNWGLFLPDADQPAIEPESETEISYELTATFATHKQRTVWLQKLTAAGVKCETKD